VALLELTIEIDPDLEPIRGRLWIPGRPAAVEFAGWVELIHVLDRLRAAEGQESGGNAGRS
jgi:hypothetical protein